MKFFFKFRIFIFYNNSVTCLMLNRVYSVNLNGTRTFPSSQLHPSGTEPFIFRAVYCCRHLEFFCCNFVKQLFRQILEQLFANFLSFNVTICSLEDFYVTSYLFKL